VRRYAPHVDEPELRRAAEERLKRKRDYRQHLFTFVLVNAFLWVLWALTDDHNGVPWPVWVTVFWGIGVAWQGWSIYGQRPIGEEEIRREMERLRGSS
jgi:2TM domain-containing protein